MPGGAGRAAAQGPRGPSVRTPAAGHGVGRCCPAPSTPRPDPGHRPKSGGGGGGGRLTGPRSTSGAPQRPGQPSLPAGVARAPRRHGPRLECLRKRGATVPTNRRRPEQSGGRAVMGGLPPLLGPRGEERRQKKGREPGSAVRAPRPALSAARAPSPAPHAPARAPRPPAPLSTPAPHTGAQPAGQTTRTPTPTAPPPRGASC